MEPDLASREIDLAPAIHMLQSHRLQQVVDVGFGEGEIDPCVVGDFAAAGEAADHSSRDVQFCLGYVTADFGSLAFLATSALKSYSAIRFRHRLSILSAHRVGSGLIEADAAGQGRELRTGQEHN